MTSYREIPWKLERLEPFHGNSMSGQTISSGENPGEIVYSVRSYATEIAKVITHPHTGSFVTLVCKRGTYSRTTSRHENLTRAHLPGGFVEVEPARMSYELEIPPALMSGIAKRMRERVNAA
jgi:hypothetical protein